MNDSNLDSAFGVIFEHASLGIIITDSEGTITSVNPFANKLFGYDVHELIGKKVEVLIPTASRKRHIGYRSAFVNRPHQRAMGDGANLSAVKKNGEQFFVEISLSYFKDQNDLKILSFINDVTKQKNYKDQLESQANMLERSVVERTKELSNALMALNHLNESLEEEITKRAEIESQVRLAFEKEKELNEMKSRFVSMASHEFRTPLAGILSSASLIQRYNEQDENPKISKHVNNIKNAVKSLTSILNDFLSLDKLEQGAIGAHPVQINLYKMIDDIEASLLSMTPDEYEVVYENNSEDRKLFQDPELIKNILLNLISNAVKYSESKDHIRISIDTDDSTLSLKVIDKGIGIPVKEQEKLFERFFRASNATNIQGTGLGLTIVKKYLEFIQGKLFFESQENQGSTFCVEVPLVMREE